MERHVALHNQIIVGAEAIGRLVVLYSQILTGAGAQGGMLYYKTKF